MLGNPAIYSRYRLDTGFLMDATPPAVEPKLHLFIRATSKWAQVHVSQRLADIPEKSRESAEPVAVYGHLYAILYVSAYAAVAPAGGGETRLRRAGWDVRLTGREASGAVVKAAGRRETSPRRLALAVRAAVENGPRRDVK